MPYDLNRLEQQLGGTVSPEEAAARAARHVIDMKRATGGGLNSDWGHPADSPFLIGPCSDIANQYVGELLYRCPQGVDPMTRLARLHSAVLLWVNTRVEVTTMQLSSVLESLSVAKQARDAVGAEYRAAVEKRLQVLQQAATRPPATAAAYQQQLAKFLAGRDLGVELRGILQRRSERGIQVGLVGCQGGSVGTAALTAEEWNANWGPQLALPARLLAQLIGVAPQVAAMEMKQAHRTLAAQGASGPSPPAPGVGVRPKAVESGSGGRSTGDPPARSQPQRNTAKETRLREQINSALAEANLPAFASVDDLAAVVKQVPAPRICYNATFLDACTAEPCRYAHYDCGDKELTAAALVQRVVEKEKQRVAEGKPRPVGMRR